MKNGTFCKSNSSTFYLVLSMYEVSAMIKHCLQNHMKNVQSKLRLLLEARGMILRLILKEEQISMKADVKEIPRSYPNEVSQQLLNVMIEKVNEETLLCITSLLTKVTEANSKIINPLFLSTYLTHGYAFTSKF